MNAKAERILSILKESPQPIAGRDLARLARMREIAAFYLLMIKMENKGLAEGRWENTERLCRLYYIKEEQT